MDDKENNDYKRSEDRKKKKKKKHSNSRSRSRSNHKKKSKKHKKKHTKSRSKSQNGRDEKPIEQMTEEELRSKAHQEQLLANEKELKNLEEKFLQAQKEAEEAKREDLTVMMYCLPTKAREKEVYKHLIYNNIGKIRDIRLIRDQRSGKSKGVAYVEFFDAEGVQRSLALNGRPFIENGKEVPYSEVKIQHSQAEKNRQAVAAKLLKNEKARMLQEQIEAMKKGPMRIYIGGLTDNLANITDGDLRALFEPFGLIDVVDVTRDPLSGKCKGYAHITYRKAEDAEAAVNNMNNYTINGRQIKVTSLMTSITPGMPLLQINPAQGQEKQGPEVQQGELDEQFGGHFLHDAKSRINLMQKLNREEQDEDGVKKPAAAGDISQNPLLMAQNPLLAGMMGAGKPAHHPPSHPIKTHYLFIGNMFTGDEVLEEATFFADLQEDVFEECSNYGKVNNVFIDSNSKGNIFVEFADMSHAEKCQLVMSQRYYNNQKIISYCITEAVFRENVDKMH